MGLQMSLASREILWAFCRGRECVRLDVCWSSVSSQTRTSGPGQITGSAERIHSRSGPHPLSLARPSNYNRANDVAVCVAGCVMQPTPKTADVTVTKIAGYVRVRILMNR